MNHSNRGLPNAQRAPRPLPEGAAEGARAGGRRSGGSSSPHAGGCPRPLPGGGHRSRGRSGAGKRRSPQPEQGEERLHSPARAAKNKTRSEKEPGRIEGGGQVAEAAPPSERGLRRAAGTELMRTAPGRHPRRAVKATGAGPVRPMWGAAPCHGSASPGRDGCLCPRPSGQSIRPALLPGGAPEVRSGRRGFAENPEVKPCPSPGALGRRGRPRS